MKNIIKVSGIIALTAIIGFSLAACNDSGGSDPLWMEYKAKVDNKEMVMRITQTAPRAFRPTAGDIYSLTWDRRTTTGAVVTYTNGEFTLQPTRSGTAPFKITTSPEGITNVSGTITWNDGTVIDADTDPRFEEANIIPGGASSSDGGSVDDGSVGTLTINGLSDYNNRKVYAIGMADDVVIYCATALNINMSDISNSTAIPGTIIGGSVTLKVFNDVIPNGVYDLVIFVMSPNKTSITFEETTIDVQAGIPDWLEDVGGGNTTFTSGSATHTFISAGLF